MKIDTMQYYISLLQSGATRNCLRTSEMKCTNLTRRLATITIKMEMF